MSDEELYRLKEEFDRVEELRAVNFEGLKPKEVYVKGKGWLPLDAWKTMDFNGKKSNRIEPKPDVEIVDGKIVRKWGSVRQASKDLYLTRQTITNYCNGKTKKKQYGLEWGERNGNIN